MSAEREALRRVGQLHQRRDLPELQTAICVEDRQDWPCATLNAIRDAEEDWERSNQADRDPHPNYQEEPF